MNEVKKISEIDRLKLENIKLRMEGLQPAVNQYYILQRESSLIVSKIAESFKMKPELVNINLQTGEIIEKPLPEIKPDNKKEVKKKK